MRVKIIIPELADVTARLAEGVDTGVRVTGGRVGGDGGVGGVGRGGGPAGEREDTADSEGGGAGARGSSPQTGALLGRVASSVEIGGRGTGVVRESDHIEDGQLFVCSAFFSPNSDRIK